MYLSSELTASETPPTSTESAAAAAAAAAKKKKKPQHPWQGLGFGPWHSLPLRHRKKLGA